MMIVPSRGRPDQLARFFAAGRPSLPGVVVLDEDDAAAYARVTLPGHWRVMMRPRATYVAHVNAAFTAFPDAPWYAALADDLICSPPGWDRILAEAAGAGRVAWGDDGINGERLTAAPFLGGALVRRAGWVLCPIFRHFYADRLWHDVQGALGNGVYRADVATRHLHWSVGLAAKDRTARERPPSAADRSAYRVFMADGFDRLVARLRCASCASSDPAASTAPTT